MSYLISFIIVQYKDVTNESDPLLNTKPSSYSSCGA